MALLYGFMLSFKTDLNVCLSFLQSQDETEATTPARQEQSVTYSREASLVVTNPASNNTETERSTEKVDNISPQDVEAEKTETKKIDNEIEVDEQGEDSKGGADSQGGTDSKEGTDSKGGDEPENDDIVQMHVIGDDENMKVKVLDQTSIAKV